MFARRSLTRLAVGLTGVCVAGTCCTAVSCASDKDKKRLFSEAFGYAFATDRGVFQPGFWDVGKIEALRTDFPLRATDVVIATFPKCGPTWMQQVQLLLVGEHGMCAVCLTACSS